MRRAMFSLTAVSALLVISAAVTATAMEDEEQGPPEVAPIETEAAAGTYRLDPAHAALVFRVNHLGFSNYTAGFTDFDATLEFDPADPAASTLEATIKVASLDLPAPPEGFLAQMLGTTWFNADSFPEMTFKSTSVEMTGPQSADISGDLTLLGVTRPVTFNAVFNGGWSGILMDPHSRIGFSAAGSLKRSDFGMDYGIPAPGTAMGVSDEVEFLIEAEFSGPPLPEDVVEEMKRQIQESLQHTATQASDDEHAEPADDQDSATEDATAPAEEASGDEAERP